MYRPILCYFCEKDPIGYQIRESTPPRGSISTKTSQSLLWSMNSYLWIISEGEILPHHTWQEKEYLLPMEFIGRTGEEELICSTSVANGKVKMRKLWCACYQEVFNFENFHLHLNWICISDHLRKLLWETNSIMLSLPLRYFYLTHIICRSTLPSSHIGNL